MEYGQIAESKKINTFIYTCFDYISKNNQTKFIKKFRKQPHVSDHIMHTFRELVLGAFLSSLGFTVEYDYRLDRQTPDWCILNKSSEPKCIVELTTFHIDEITNEQIEKQSQNGKIVVYWQNENRNNTSIYDKRPNRLYQCLLEKTIKYNSLIKKKKIAYVVSLFSDFKIDVNFEDDLCPLLINKDTGLFKYKELSGVIHFKENAGCYYFRYAQNVNASQAILIPDGIFPPIDEAT